MSELSDGTLRYLLLMVALLSPRPPAFMVLNEPEMSLHPDLLPALGRLIAKASERSQVLVVSHSRELVDALEAAAPTNRITQILKGQRAITADTALRLGQWLGTGPELWLNLQKAYELRLAEQQVGPEIARLIIPRHAN